MASDLKVLNYKFLKDYEKELVEEETFGSNSTEVASDELQPADCPCKNGRCVWKGIRKECVCNPEFGRVSDSECEYCDCGRGFNCTFNLPYRKYQKVNCICTEGYYDSGSSCRAVCNSTHPCQNGGRCLDGHCDCKKGTMGDFCESIYWCSYECRPRLIVDCVYDQKTEGYICLCKNRSLLYDYEEQVCKPCPCGEGTCKYTRPYVKPELHCDCNAGYKEFRGRCKKCDCGPNSSCEYDQKTGEKICKCEEGFATREGRCIACNCGLEKVKCDLINNTKHCYCPVGYEELHGTCEDINECLTNNTCHPTTKCINTIGSFKCECEEGYRKPEQEEFCEDINECAEDSNICKNWNSVKCVNLPGTYKCECLPGYEPTDMNVDPRKTKCQKCKYIFMENPYGIHMNAFCKYRWNITCIQKQYSSQGIEDSFTYVAES
ncbi:uncharacterized protein TNCT_366511 [Trichonephila clavata]|uniref:EGF-like domain-containing protein n=1 Tax=Trichonephila clavata TaxID=2740835 RepID=A0A8X6HNP3_TRICU|nr:uncharacterized protein TNCT_366511 [Trichonephila clavata]